MSRLPRSTRVVLGRMIEFWVYGTGPTALLLLLLAPAILPGQPLPVILTYLALPIYMLHQVEEYDAGLVRRTMGGILGPQHAGLRLGQVAAINLGLVWLPLATTFWLVLRVEPGWAVLAAWLMIGNAALHIGQASVQGRYNPGLVTAITLFFPLGGAILARVSGNATQHVASMIAVVLLHLTMVAVAYAPNRDKPR